MKLERAAIRKGYDSIVLLTERALGELTVSGKLPRSIGLNILRVSRDGPGSESGS